LVVGFDDDLTKSSSRQDIAQKLRVLESERRLIRAIFQSGRTKRQNIQFIFSQRTPANESHPAGPLQKPVKIGERRNGVCESHHAKP